MNDAKDTEAKTKQNALKKRDKQKDKLSKILKSMKKQVKSDLKKNYSNNGTEAKNALECLRDRINTCINNLATPIDWEEETVSLCKNWKSASNTALKSLRVVPCLLKIEAKLGIESTSSPQQGVGRSASSSSSSSSSEVSTNTQCDVVLCTLCTSNVGDSETKSAEGKSHLAKQQQQQPYNVRSVTLDASSEKTTSTSTSHAKNISEVDQSIRSTQYSNKRKALTGNMDGTKKKEFTRKKQQCTLITKKDETDEMQTKMSSTVKPVSSGPAVLCKNFQTLSARLQKIRVAWASGSYVNKQKIVTRLKELYKRFGCNASDKKPTSELSLDQKIDSAQQVIDETIDILWKAVNACQDKNDQEISNLLDGVLELEKDATTFVKVAHKVSAKEQSKLNKANKYLVVLAAGVILFVTSGVLWGIHSVTKNQVFYIASSSCAVVAFFTICASVLLALFPSSRLEVGTVSGLMPTLGEQKV